MENQNCKELLKNAQLNDLPEGVGMIVRYMVDHIDNLSVSVNELNSRTSELSKRISGNTKDLRDIKEEYPLLPPEADDLSKEVKRKGVAVLGSKTSEAYQDVGLRKRVYQDIYMEIKRNYGLIDEKGIQQSYKKLKRKYLNGAIELVREYEPPITLANEILSLNDLEEYE